MKPLGMFGDLTGDSTSTSTSTMFTFAGAAQAPETMTLDLASLAITKLPRANTLAFDPSKVSQRVLQLKNSDGSPLTAIVLSRNDLAAGKKHNALMALHYGHIGQPTPSMYNRNLQLALESEYAVVLV